MTAAQTKYGLQVKTVPINSLTPNQWNPNTVSPENELKLEESLRRHGFFKPALVRELSNGKLEIIGGEHRVLVARKLGYTEVPIVNLGKIDDQRAKEVALLDNARYGNDDTLQLAALLKDLGDVGELGTFMPYTDAEFASIFAASSIALDDLDIPDGDGEAPLPSTAPPQTHAVMRFKVPVEDVERIQLLIEGVMKAQKFTDEDSLANAGNALVWLLSQGK